MTAQQTSPAPRDYDLNFSGTGTATLHLCVVADAAFLKALANHPHLQAVNIPLEGPGGIIDLRVNSLFDRQTIEAALAPLVTALIERRGAPQPSYTKAYSIDSWGCASEGMYAVYLQVDADEELLAALRIDPATRDLTWFKTERRVFLARYLAYSEEEYRRSIARHLDAFLGRCQQWLGD